MKIDKKRIWDCLPLVKEECDICHEKTTHIVQPCEGRDVGFFCSKCNSDFEEMYERIMAENGFPMSIVNRKIGKYNYRAYYRQAKTSKEEKGGN